MSTVAASAKRWLYHGTVYHARTGPNAGSFRYPAVFLCFPLSQSQDLASRLFGVNRARLFAFYDRDHGKGGNPRAWIRGILHSRHVTCADGEVWLMTMPRILGFVFNPVSFWYCHDRSGQLRAVLCEVNNTFGDRHGYLLTAPGHAAISGDTVLGCEKIFHVSPFFPVEGDYRFRFRHEDGLRSVHIDYFRGDALALTARLSGRAMPLTDANLLRTLCRFGLATLMVVIRIHWQAVRLWARKTPFHSRPAPPAQEVSP